MKSLDGFIKRLKAFIYDKVLIAASHYKFRVRAY